MLSAGGQGLAGRVWRRVWRGVVGETQTEKLLKHVAKKEYQNQVQFWKTSRELRGQVLGFIQHSTYLASKLKDANKQRVADAKQFEILQNIFSLKNLRQLGSTDGAARKKLEQDLYQQLQSVLVPPSPSSPSTSSSTSSTPSTSTASATNASPLPPHIEQAHKELLEPDQPKTGFVGRIAEWIDGNKDDEDFATINARFTRDRLAFEKEEEQFWAQLPLQELKDAFEGLTGDKSNPKIDVSNIENIIKNKSTNTINTSTSTTTSSSTKSAETPTTTTTTSTESTSDEAAGGIPSALVQQMKERQAMKAAGKAVPKIDLSSIPKETLDQLRKQHLERKKNAATNTIKEEK